MLAIQDIAQGMMVRADEHSFQKIVENAAAVLQSSIRQPTWGSLASSSSGNNVVPRSANVGAAGRPSKKRTRSAWEGAPPRPKKGSKAKKTCTFCSDVTHNIAGCAGRKGHWIKLARNELEFRNGIIELANLSSPQFPASTALPPCFDDHELD